MTAKRRVAFTLLELLLAMTLTTVLMVGVMMVIANLGLSGLYAARSDATGTPRPQQIDRHVLDAFTALLREDLMNATAIAQSNTEELILEGHAALDSILRQRMHRPVRVRYRFTSIGDRRWLIREQIALDEPDRRRVQRDPVCTGIVDYQLTPVPPSAEGQAIRQAVAQANAADTPASANHRFVILPDNAAQDMIAYQLRIKTDDPAQAVYERLIIVPAILSAAPSP